MSRMLRGGAVAVLLTGAVTAAGVAGTDESRAPGHGGASIARSPDEPCFATFTHGSFGESNSMSVCISNEGNVVSFEAPIGFEHLFQVEGDDFLDGFAICDSAGTHGWDMGEAEAGFGASTITQPNGPNTLPLKIKRDTDDGAYRLVQSYQFVPDSGELRITNKITNLGPRVTEFHFSRVGELDAGGDFGDDVALRTPDSIVQTDVDVASQPARGLMLAPYGSTYNEPHLTYVEDFDDLVVETFDDCVGIGQAVPTAEGDWSMRLDFGAADLRARETRTYVIRYGRT